MSSVLAFPKSAVVRRRRPKSAARAIAQEITGLGDAVMDWAEIKSEAQVLRYMLAPALRTLDALLDKIDEQHPAP